MNENRRRNKNGIRIKSKMGITIKWNKDTDKNRMKI